MIANAPYRIRWAALSLKKRLWWQMPIWQLFDEMELVGDALRWRGSIYPLDAIKLCQPPPIFGVAPWQFEHCDGTIAVEPQLWRSAMSWNVKIAGSREAVRAAVEAEAMMPEATKTGILAEVDMAAAVAAKRTESCAHMAPPPVYGVIVTSWGHIDSHSYGNDTKVDVIRVQ